MHGSGGARGAAFAAVAIGIVCGIAARAATLTVHVKDGQTGSPLPGAFVMVGLYEGDPFHGNLGLTDGTDLAVTRSLITHFYGVPSGDEILAVSGALIDSGDRELAIGYDTRGGLIDTVSVFELASRAPGGDLSDATNVVLGAYADSSVAVRYSTGIVDREGFVPPHTAVFQSWMLLPVMSQQGRHFTWEDPTNPGVSPSPTWTRSNLGLRAIDPADSTIAVSTYWRVYAPAELRHFLLPLLPETAPGPPGGLPDPDETDDADQLYWTFVATNSSGTGAEVIDDFIRGATHWTRRWDPIAAFSTAVDDGAPIPPSVALWAAPNPAATEVRLRWSTALPGSGRLELRAPDGRLIRGFPAPARGRPGALGRARRAGAAGAGRRLLGDAAPSRRAARRAARRLAARGALTSTRAEA
jgi:hypothetical protein